MATFNIYGANSQTGEDIRISIEAASAAEAEAIASARQIMVERVVPAASINPRRIVTPILTTTPQAAPSPRPSTSPARMPQTQPARASQSQPVRAPRAVAPPPPPPPPPPLMPPLAMPELMPPPLDMPQALPPAFAVPGYGGYGRRANADRAQRASGLGVASFVMGAVGLLICWIPLIGIAAVPLCGMALALAFWGFVWARVRGDRGVGWQIAGGAVAAVALLIGLAQARLISDPSAGLGWNQSWVSADKAVQHGDFEVRVTSVAVKMVPLSSGFSRGAYESDKPALVVGLVVRNLSSTRRLAYHTWAGRDLSEYGDFGTLQDKAGTGYKRVWFGASHLPVGRVESDSIRPGQSISDVLIFEPPSADVESLHLTLPGANVDCDGVVKLEIPASMIRR